MILLNRVVHIFTATNGNRFSSLAEPALYIALHYSYSVGLASIDGNARWPAVAGQGLAYKAFSSGQITMFAEIELNRIAIAIDGTIQVQPLSFDQL